MSHEVLSVSDSIELVKDPKALVAAGYDQMHQRYAAWSTGNDDVLRHRYIDWVIESALISEGGPILDLGCGTGALATRYLAERFEVTGVDISPKSIGAARREVPNAHFVVADMASVDFAGQSFDLVTAFYSLIHVRRTEHSTVLNRVASWLRPCGVLIATMTAGNGGEGTDANWLGAPMYWSNWDAETNLRLLKEARFEIVRSATEQTVEDGRSVPFLWVIGRTPKDT